MEEELERRQESEVMGNSKELHPSGHNRTDELMGTVVPCIRPTQVQARWGPSTEKRK